MAGRESRHHKLAIGDRSLVFTRPVHSPSLDRLRRYAVARSLFEPTTLAGALSRFGFVQADPIRAPARAQDLTLRHRVRDYHTGDLERCYARLDIEEDFFTVYGFVTRPLSALMHPRSMNGILVDGRRPWSAARRKQARLLLEFVRERGTVHPREVDAHFMHGKVTNYWGGTSNATTHLLAAMHYRGMLRVARRDAGIRLYAVHRHGPELDDIAQRQARLDAMVDVLVQIYAPLHCKLLGQLVRRLRYAAPQWQRQIPVALARAKKRLAHARIDGVDWYWPADENPGDFEPDDAVRLLAPFDPIVWDRNRFELLWNWAYRFEAYTPAAKRKLGYYALPMLWRDRVIGWGNVLAENGKLKADFGYIGSRPKGPAFARELDAEIDRLRRFLGG
jgi:uncharacterized protein YcaQ